MGQLPVLGSSLWPLSGPFPAWQHLFGTVKILYITRKLCFDQSLQLCISHFIFITASTCGNQTLLQSTMEVILEDLIILNYFKSVIFHFGGGRSQSGLLRSLGLLQKLFILHHLFAGCSFMSWPRHAREGARLCNDYTASLGRMVSNHEMTPQVNFWLHLPDHSTKYNM